MLFLHIWSIIIFIVINNMCVISSAPLQGRGTLGGRILKGVKGKLFSGSGTFYEVGSGSCGESDSDSDLVVAVNFDQMKNGVNPNNNPTCQKTVFITGDMGSTSARVVDTCPSCPKGALDMSPKVFELVCGSLAVGVCTINWNFT